MKKLISNVLGVLILCLAFLFNISANSLVLAKEVEQRVEPIVFQAKHVPELKPIAEEVIVQQPFQMTMLEFDREIFRGYCSTYDMYDNNPLTGFVDDWGFCVPGLVTNKVWFTKSPQYTYGSAVFYSPGVMRATAKWRSYEMYNVAYHFGEYIGAVAVPSPADIGDTVWLRREGTVWEGPYLVVDCSRRADMFTHIVINQQVVEVDYTTAMRWGMIEGTWDNWKVLHYSIRPVEIWYGVDKPAEDIQDILPPVYFAQWWEENVADYQRIEIEKTPWYYPNGLNPTWDLRDGKGEQCFTTSCLKEEN